MTGEGYKKGYGVQFLALNCLLKITAIITSDGNEANKVLLDSISDDDDSTLINDGIQGMFVYMCIYIYISLCICICTYKHS